MLRRMVNSHARRLVPGWNLSDLLHALKSVSCTRSSASDADPDREMANARRLPISATSSSLKLAVGIRVSLGLSMPLFLLELGEQIEEFLRQRSADEIVVMRFQRMAYRLQNLWVQRSIALGPVLGRI